MSEGTDPPMTERVQLLSADAEFAEVLAPDERELAERLVVMEVRRTARGPWEPDLRTSDGKGFALLVLRGAITREISLAGRRSSQLFGPGDILGPAPSGDSLVPHEVAWTVSEAGVVGVLDDRFRMAVRRWPALGAVVDSRLLEQSNRLALHVAIAQLGRVELRVLALLWHLADRWGHVTPQGVHVPLKLTHEALGRLVGAQRPTVTLALVELARTGEVMRSDSGGWVLDPESRESLSPSRAGAMAPPARLAS
jgi:CRP-like cAMP-binding protein